jgi:hypothetical protein
MVRVTDSNMVQFSQTLGRGGHGGTFDWSSTAFFSRRVSLGAGFGYASSYSALALTERLSATVELPFDQTVQLSYVNTPAGRQLNLQLRGPLFRSRSAQSAARAPLAELRSLGAFYGKVYQDLNLNGHFDPGVDRPQADVAVRVDGNLFAVTDLNGDFRIESVKSGEHSIYLDLLTVRADLTLLDPPKQLATLNPGRDTIVDFRVVRTGRISGAVFLDANGNGRMDEGEQLADVRIVTASGRDTLTDAHGAFVLGDLPPGEHVVLVDEKTLPDGVKSAVSLLQVSVKAGAETGEVLFPIVDRPADVNVKRFK